MNATRPTTSRGSLLAALLTMLPGLALISACSDAPPAATGCATDADCPASNNLCLGQRRCDAKLHVCAVDPATIVRCDAKDDTACAAAACDPTDGACKVVARADGLPCEDGDPCTLAERCKAGSCAVGEDVCSCRKDADCAQDGDACNGEERCDRAAFPYRCATDLATAVACPEPTTPCQVAACETKTGGCSLVAAPDQSPCDDGDLCTTGDHCEAGACVGATDTCACKGDADCDDPDGNPCTGVPFCDLSGAKGVCKPNPATVVTCPTTDDTACLHAVCEAADGACHLRQRPDQTPCDDGDACTQGEQCVAGGCTAGKDVCACKSDDDCKDADDGDLCNGTPFCNLQTGACETNPKTVVTCANVDDTACSKHVCVAKTGVCTATPRDQVKLAGCIQIDLGGGILASNCLYVPKGANEAGDPGPFACDDGDSCTGGDTCQGGTCQGGKVVCECKADADCVAKDDGNLCNGVQFCDTSKAVPTCAPLPNSAIYCSKLDDTDCQASACNPKTGTCALGPRKAGTPCDDGEPCTASSSCQGGVCVPGAALGCDDGDACTIDSCVAGQGCSHLAKPCDDGNSCTISACDPAKGTCTVVARPAGTTCDADSDGCTVGDACDGKGACVVGAPAVCAPVDGACVQAVCQSKGGAGFVCVTAQRPDGTVCPDGEPCFTGAACKGGSCVAGTLPTLWQKGDDASSASAWQAGVFATAPVAKASGDGSGALIVAGPAPAGPSAGSIVVRAIGRDGATAWQVTTTPPAGVQAFVDVVAVLDRGPLGVVVVANAMRPQLGPVPATWTVAPDGVATPVVLHQSSASAQGSFQMFVVAAKLHPTGALVMAGRPTQAAGKAIFAMRSLEGNEIWSNEVNQKTAGKVVLVVDSAGTTTISFSLHYLDAFWVLFQASFGASGTENWTGGYGDPAFALEPVAAVLVGESRMALYLSVTGPPGAQLGAWWYQGVDSKGAISVDLPVTETSLAPQHAVGIGDVLLWARSDAGTIQLGVLDDAGRQPWQRSFNDGPAVLDALVASPDRERFALLGHSGAGDSAKAQLRLFDRWGFPSCQERGLCAQLSWATCDDDNDCTNDRCEASFGCIHLVAHANPCDPGLPCTSSGSCTTGSCQPNDDGRTFVGRTVKQGESFLGLVEGADGGVDSWRTRLDDGTGTPTLMRYSYGLQATVETVDLAGMWYTPVGTTLADRSADGTIVLAGGAEVEGKTVLRTSWLAHGLGPAGLSVDAVDPHCASCSVLGRALATATGASAYALGISERDKGQRVLSRTVMSFVGGTYAAKLAWVEASNLPGASFDPRGLGARGNGGVAWVGAATNGAGTRPVLGLVDADGGGKALLVDTKTLDGGFEDVCERSDGSLLAVGGGMVGTVQRSLLVAYTPGLTELWRQQPPIADGRLWINVHPEPGGLFAVAGFESGAAPDRLVLSHRAADGTTQWLRTLVHAQFTSLRPARGALLKLDDGGYAVGVIASADFASATLVARSDASGYFSCRQAGTCASKAMDACDDANPCTVDWCSPDGSCSHAPADGSPCGGAGVCKAGLCGSP